MWIGTKNGKAISEKVTFGLNTSIVNHVSTKTMRWEFHKLNIHGHAAFAKLLVNDVNTTKERK